MFEWQKLVDKTSQWWLLHAPGNDWFHLLWAFHDCLPWLRFYLHVHKPTALSRAHLVPVQKSQKRWKSAAHNVWLNGYIVIGALSECLGHGQESIGSWSSRYPLRPSRWLRASCTRLARQGLIKCWGCSSGFIDRDKLRRRCLLLIILIFASARRACLTHVHVPVFHVAGQLHVPWIICSIMALFRAFHHAQQIQANHVD